MCVSMCVCIFLHIHEIPLAEEFGDEGQEWEGQYLHSTFLCLWNFKLSKYIFVQKINEWN